MKCERDRNLRGGTPLGNPLSLANVKEEVSPLHGHLNLCNSKEKTPQVNIPSPDLKHSVTHLSQSPRPLTQTHAQNLL